MRMKERKPMKVKIKKVYKDEVEPTLSMEIDVNSNESVDTLNKEVSKLVKSILNSESKIKGLFISCDK